MAWQFAVPVLIFNGIIVRGIIASRDVRRRWRVLVASITMAQASFYWCIRLSFRPPT